jgi:hypothetical protein
MQKQQMYTIRDNVAELFNKPFFAVNNATAIRSFASAMQKEPHKNDYALYRVGEFNEDNGEVTPEPPQKIYTGFDIKEEEINNVSMLKAQNS